MCFLFARGQVVGVADHAALAATERDIDDGAFPGHPCGEGAHGIDGLLGVEPDAALGGSAGIVVLDPESLKDLHCAIIHPDGDGEVVLALRRSQQLPNPVIELKQLGNRVELALGHGEGVELVAHVPLQYSNQITPRGQGACGLYAPNGWRVKVFLARLCAVRLAALLSAGRGGVKRHERAGQGDRD